MEKKIGWVPLLDDNRENMAIGDGELENLAAELAIQENSNVYYRNGFNLSYMFWDEAKTILSEELGRALKERSTLVIESGVQQKELSAVQTKVSHLRSLLRKKSAKKRGRKQVHHSTPRPGRFLL